MKQSKVVVRFGLGMDTARPIHTYARTVKEQYDDMQRDVTQVLLYGEWYVVSEVILYNPLMFSESIKALCVHVPVYTENGVSSHNRKLRCFTPVGSSMRVALANIIPVRLTYIGDGRFLSSSKRINKLNHSLRSKAA